MKVRRPLWLEHPEKPRSRYQRENRLTIAWGEVRVVRSVAITKGEGRPREGDLTQAQKGRPQFPVAGDDPSAAPGPCWPRWSGGCADFLHLAVRGRRHVPRQGGDLFRPEPGLYGKQQDQAVSKGVAGSREVVEGGVDLRLRQGLRLLAESQIRLQTDDGFSIWCWIITSRALEVQGRFWELPSFSG